MIRFRQKEFAWPALAALGSAAMNTAMVGGTIMSVKQGIDQSKQAEEHQQQMLNAQKRENAKLTKSLDKLAAAASSNPQVAAEAGLIVGKSKLFASPAKTAISGFLKKAGQFTKDAIGAVGSGTKTVKVDSGKKVIDKFGRTGLFKKGKSVNLNKYVKETDPTGIGKVGKTLIGLGTSGAIMSGSSYLVDKAITSDARKIGMMPKKDNNDQRNYAIPASIMSKAGHYAKQGVKYTISKKNLLNGGNMMMAGFAALPAVGYLSSRSQYKDQIKQQENNTVKQKTYAIPTKSVMSSIRRAMKKPFRNWDGMKTITGGMANLSSLGNYGKREIQAYGNRLSKSSNSWAKNTGNWIKKNPNKANLAGAAIGSAVIGTSMSMGEKLTRKTLKKLDKDAYAYEEMQNQSMN